MPLLSRKALEQLRHDVERGQFDAQVSGPVSIAVAFGRMHRQVATSYICMCRYR
jgi:hypothetical protein